MLSPSSGDCIALGTVLPLIVITCMAFRFYSTIKRQRIGTDDYLALYSLAVYLVMSAILVTGAVRYSFGGHTYAQVTGGFNEDMSELTTSTKHLDFICELLLPWGIGSAKLSILFFYRRIFSGRVFNIVSLLLMFYCASWSITFFCLDLLQCGAHINSLWSSEKAIGVSCLPGSPLGYTNAILDFVPDVLILALPMHSISILQMAPGRKIFVQFIFLFGALAVIASLARTVIFVMIYRVHNTDPDQLAFLTNKTYFETLELGISLIAISLPKLTTFLSEKRKRAVAHHLNRIAPSGLHWTTQAESLVIPYPKMNKHMDPIAATSNNDSVRRAGEGVAASCFAYGVKREAEEGKDEGNIMVRTELSQDVIVIRKWV